jgi:hypothetical protein
MDSRQGGFASCPFSSLGCGLRVSFRWRLVAGESFVLRASRGETVCPNTHRVASHVRPHPIGAVAAWTTGEPTASRRQWRVGVPMADPMRPQRDSHAITRSRRSASSTRPNPAPVGRGPCLSGRNLPDSDAERRSSRCHSLRGAHPRRRARRALRARPSLRRDVAPLMDPCHRAREGRA